MTDATELGKRVARMRERRRMTQQELAEKAKISYQSLWRIERGTQGKPSIFTIAAIARVLGVSMDYLAGLYEDKDDEMRPAAVARVCA